MAQKDRPDTKRFTAQDEALLFQGASISQLSRMFKMDNRTVKAKLFGLKPNGTRAGSPIFDVGEAARYLVKPIWSIEEYISRMTHMDLPMMLRKEFWAGMRSRQIYEKEAGDLWPTDKVQEHMAEVLKVIALSLRLTADTVERETGLTEAQRQIVLSMMDDALNGARHKLREAFEHRPVKETEEDGDSRAESDDEEL